MDTTGDYKYKGWTIFGKSDYNKQWYAEASFLIDEFVDNDDVLDFICNNRLEHESMTTLAKTKVYIRQYGDIEAEKLRNELKVALTRL